MSTGLIYLASPYTHPDPAVRQQRFEAVCKAAAHLMKQGLHIFSPIAHTHPIALAGDFPKGWDFWEQYDRLLLNASAGMMVLMLDGWRDSKGVQAEMQIMHQAKRRVDFIDPQTLVVDHIDGNGLNNQRTNLRVVTHQTNQRNQHRRKLNRSGLPMGVAFCNGRTDRFQAQTKVRGRHIHLGTFESIGQAHSAYLEFRQKMLASEQGELCAK